MSELPPRDNVIHVAFGAPHRPRALPPRDGVPMARPRVAPTGAMPTAYQHFLEGCRLDGDEAAAGRAEQAYRAALALDPSLGCAHTNLGALLLTRGARDEAAAHFARAMAVDPDQPEAPYNAGFLRLEAGDAAGALPLLALALDLDPELAPAHFAMARALEALGHDARAAIHWASYAALEPEGPGIDLARQRGGGPRGP